MAMSTEVSHLVCRRTNGAIATTPVDFYALGGDFSNVSYVPVEDFFGANVFTVTDSYGDVTTAHTTWNYENRVGVVYFEIAPDTTISPNGIKLYFKVAPEVYNTIYNSNNATLNYYSLPLELVDIQEDGSLSIDKTAYLLPSGTSRVCSPSPLSELKALGENYAVLTLNALPVLRLRDDRRIVALRFALSLAEDAELPTGFNYVPILVDSFNLLVEETVIPHPVNFRMLPTADDITLLWESPVFNGITGYRIDVQQQLETSYEFGIYEAIPGVAGYAPQLGKWASLYVHDTASSTVEVPLKNHLALCIPPQTWDATKKYIVRVTTLVGGDDFEFSVPTYNLKAGVGVFSVPDPPRNARVFAGNHKFFVSWDSPLANIDCPIHKFELSVFNVDLSVVVTPTPISVHRAESVTAYETYGVEINDTNSLIENYNRYRVSIVSVNAVGSSLATETGVVLVAPAKRSVETGNNKYKKFYRYPVELKGSLLGSPLYPESVVENGVVRVENHVPTVEYDLQNKKCLSDRKPFIPVVETFEITPATRSNKTKSDYPLSFHLRHTDIRAGSLSIEWYVNGVKEVITDTGNGSIISAEKVDACGNKIPSQQLGFVDYVTGTVSCSLPQITSGSATIRYVANKPVMDNQQYIWSPTPHFGLSLNLKEPVYFGPSQWAYLNQNADRLRPGYTVLEFIDATIDLRSALLDAEDSISVS